MGKNLRLPRLILLWMLLMSIACSFESESSSPSGSGIVPAAPSDVTAAAGNSQVKLQWKAVAGASSYNIYWAESPGVSPATGKKITEPSSSYIHTGLTNGATYYYVITAVNAYGESGKSAEVAVALNDAPPAPTGVSASSGEGQVVIAWNQVENATTYKIYWSNAPDVQMGKRAKLEDVVSPYTHRGLSNGSPYYYVVTAVNDSGESGPSPEVSAIPRTDPDNAHLRAVWVQDTGDGSDVDAMGKNLRLMGADSRDGKGERMILGVGSYAKPLITPRGDRVVYTDRIRKKVCVVNWDGSGMRELFGGFGLAVWRNPGDGREWIYYGFEEARNGGMHCPAVYRTPLDNPGVGELVWNKTPVSVDNFQISADGRIGGGNLPWPAGGTAELPNQAWNRVGSGCWASLSPDNSYLLWLLDDSHRKIFITDRSGNSGRTVNISEAPGIEGYEVYHPRWSNHPLILTMTGPYKVGSGANRIAGGGPDVEIYIGRFNADFTAVESWWRLTSNSFGDFFPDVWVSP